MEIISNGENAETLYIGTCNCGCVAIYTRAESEESQDVNANSPHGLIVKCPICAEGYLFSPYMIYKKLP